MAWRRARRWCLAARCRAGVWMAPTEPCWSPGPHLLKGGRGGDGTGGGAGPARGWEGTPRSEPRRRSSGSCSGRCGKGNVLTRRGGGGGAAGLRWRRGPMGEPGRRCRAALLETRFQPPGSVRRPACSIGITRARWRRRCWRWPGLETLYFAQRRLPMSWKRRFP